MATLWIGEFRGAGIEGNVMTPAYVVPAVANQTVTFTSTQGRSAAFNGATRVVRLVADVACYVEFGDVTVAAVNGSDGTYLPAGTPTDFFVSGLSATHVSAIAA